MSTWWTAVSAVVTVCTLAALGLREWVVVRRGPGAVPRRWDVALAVLVIAFAGLMVLRLSSAG